MYPNPCEYEILEPALSHTFDPSGNDNCVREPCGVAITISPNDD